MKSFATLVVGLALMTRAYSLAPYTPDANTTFLFHLDEPAGESVAANAVVSEISGFSAITFDGDEYAGDGTVQPTITSTLGSSGFTGFGNAASLTERTGIGVDINGDDAFLVNDDAPLSSDRFANHRPIFGESGSFTLEAMINVSEIDSAQEIISTDGNYANTSGGNLSRGFQFRIVNGNLEFLFIGANLAFGVTDFAIPEEGPHSFVANEWFHVAVSFDGENARLYWTRVDSGVTAANFLTEGRHRIDLDDGGQLVLGNEARTGSPTAAAESPLAREGLRGLLDEVRISNIVRDADDFIFSNTPSEGEEPPVFTSITRAADGSQVTFSWKSRPDAFYFIEFSRDLERWVELDQGFLSQGENTTFVDDALGPAAGRGFYRLSETTPPP